MQSLFFMDELNAQTPRCRDFFFEDKEFTELLLSLYKPLKRNTQRLCVSALKNKMQNHNS